MKTSEVIAQLTKLQAEHGDLPVVSHAFEDPCEIDHVEYVDSLDDQFPQGYFWLE